MPSATKKILACCSIAGLLSATVLISGCSKQEDRDGDKKGQHRSGQQEVIVDDDLEQLGKPDGTEMKIRGKSG